MKLSRDEARFILALMLLFWFGWFIGETFFN